MTSTDTSLRHDEEGLWFREVWADQGAAISLQIRRKLEEVQSPYQKVEVFETEHFGNLLTLDGLVMLTTRDNFLYHEMMTHPALYSHPRPRRVLVIGGGDCGSIQQVLRHPTVEQAVQVEIDEVVTRLSERYFPELCTSNGDPRAHFVFEDAYAWLDRAEAASFDVVIVDGSDPLGPAAVLFSEEFYRRCWRVLGEGGVLICQTESPLFHQELIETAHLRMRAAGFADTRTLCFPQCVYPSGWWSATLARRGAQIELPRADRLEPVLPCRYYTPRVHAAAFALPAFLAAALPAR